MARRTAVRQQALTVGAKIFRRFAAHRSAIESSPGAHAPGYRTHAASRLTSGRGRARFLQANNTRGREVSFHIATCPPEAR